MGFLRWGYDFDGPYLSPSRLENQAGVYVLWRARGRRWDVLEVEGSGAVRDQLLAHGRVGYGANVTVYYSATYAPGTTPEARDWMAQQICSRLPRPPRARRQPDDPRPGAPGKSADPPPPGDAPKARRIKLRNACQDARPPDDA